MWKKLKEIGHLGVLGFVAYSFILVWSVVQIGNTYTYLGQAPGQSAEERRYSAYLAYQESQLHARERLASKANGNSNYPGRYSDEKLVSDDKPLDSFEDPYLNANAQEGMWRASEYLVYISLFQFLLGGASVWLIYRTLESSNSTLTSAREATLAGIRTAEAAENAERAHVLPIAEFTIVDEEGHALNESEILSGSTPYFIQPEVSIKNFGKTPARNVSFTVIYQPWAAGGVGPPGPMMTIRANGRVVILAPNQNIIPVVHEPHGTEDTVQPPSGAPDEPDYFIWIRVSYKTLFDRDDDPDRIERLRYVANMSMKRVDSGKGSRYVRATAVRASSELFDDSEWPDGFPFRS